jgi:hypothetical protein
MNNLDNIPDLTSEEFKEGKSGYIYAPYVTKTVKTSVNGVTVWYSNKMINLWLKIKFFFYTPKALKNFEKYSNKPIDSKYYEEITIKKDENE